MIGMEKMIAQMLGITPEAMNDMVTGFQTLLTSLQTRLATIEQQQREILTILGAIHDDETNGSPRVLCDNRSDTGAGSGDGNGGSSGGS